MMITLRKNQLIKQKEVAEIKKIISEANVVLLINYQGLKVVNFQDWKKKLKDSLSEKIILRVYKNTLLKRAFANTKYETINTFIKGMLFFVSTGSSSLSSIKLLAKFIEAKKNVNFIGGIYNQEVVSKKEIIELSLLPTREELLTQLIFSLKFAPLNLILTLENIIKNKNKLKNSTMSKKT